MTFELINLAPYAVGFLMIAALSMLLVLGVGTEFLLTNRKARVAREESIPAYYGQLLGAH